MKYELNSLIGQITEADCEEVLAQLPDKCVDLVLTDPPYGIGAGREKPHNGWIDHGISDWDLSSPSANAFKEIRRVSKNQIVWGGNYFTEHLPPSMCWFFWDKGQRDFSLADGELAWSSFNRALRVFSYSRAAALQEGKCHPTQKPVPLFVWCLMKYSKPGDLVIDPFCGSGTTALACHKTGRRFICIDREPKYIEIAQQRYRELVAQTELFGAGDIESGATSANTQRDATPAQGELKLL